jgi:hypothetical protein
MRRGGEGAKSYDGENRNRGDLPVAAPAAATTSESIPEPMDQISIKTPTPICRLYWVLIEFIDWRYVESVMLVFSTALVN